MPNLTSITVTAGVPTAGTGTVSTLDALMADGGQASLGAKADAAQTDQTQTASLISVAKGIIGALKSLVVLGAGSNLIGKVQPTGADGSTNAAAHPLYAQLTDSAAAEVLGAVTASPAANTVLDRLKTINTTLGSPLQAGGAIAVSDGSDATQGAKADAAYAGSGSISVIGALKGLYAAMVAATPAGTNLMGKVGIDQTTPFTTNAVAGNERWAAGKGQGLTWGSAFGASDLNSIVNGNAIQSTTVIANATALDLFADISISLASLTTGAGAPYLGLYLMPLNQDGTTYGDGRFGSSAAGPPASQYYVGAIPLIPSVTQAQTGSMRGVLLPPGSFVLIAYNQAGATLASSTNVVKYRTYNRSLN